jgi:hypothetical protein
MVKFVRTKNMEEENGNKWRLEIRRNRLKLGAIVESGRIWKAKPLKNKEFPGGFDRIESAINIESTVCIQVSY